MISAPPQGAVGVTAQQLQFGDFTLDQSRYQLQRGDRPVRLEKLPMELLILLVERRGELVTREEIAERLWGKGVFLDVDHGINTAVRKIRLVLRDDPDAPRFVETVVGKGYRFAAPISSSNGASKSQAHPASSPTESHPPQALPSAQRSVGWLRRWGLFGVATALAIFAVAWLVSRHGHPQASSTQPRINGLAVLPLKNLSGDPTQEYFADGMTEELIGRLSQIHSLSVISRTSVMRFKDSKMSVPDIAKALHVDAIVEGSVIRDGNRVRINAQLIRGSTDEHIWAQEYQREYRDILVLQQEVAQAIVQQIKINMTPQERGTLAATRVIDAEAHEDYLKGRYYSSQRDEEALKRSIGFFQEAIARDPNYALAYSGLADAYALLGFRGGLPSKDSLSRAKSAALKAIELDSTLAEPHASLAFIAETHEWQWATAEREYKRALELNPDDARAHHWYAGYLMYVGRFDEGIAEENRARELDPVSLPVNNALAGRLLVAGRYDEALLQVEKTLELDSNFAPAHQTLGWAYLNKGKGDQAIQEFQRAVQLSGPDNGDLALDLGVAYAELGKPQEARRILAQLKALHERGLMPSGSIGILYGALGDFNDAFAWLDKAYKERDPELTYIKVPGRRFEPLRHDPRFQQLVRRIGLPDT